MRPSAYDDGPYPITRELIEDGRKHLVLNAPFETGCPVRILQGSLDPDVPWQHAMKLVACLPKDDVAMTLVKDGDHRLSRPEDIERLLRIVDELAASVRLNRSTSRHGRTVGHPRLDSLSLDARDKRGHDDLAAFHSSITAASLSRPAGGLCESHLAPRAATAPRPRHPAPAARGRPSSRSASRASAASPELPIAISTLRTKRSRPVRLIGLLAKRLRKAASSSRASSASVGGTVLRARRKLRLAPGLRELVPRADRQAIVAAIDAVADLLAELARDRALVLDGEIRNAAPRIEPVGRRERFGRADVETRAARAAMIGLRRIERQFQRREQRAQKQPRAELARHHVGVLALPAEPGGFGERLLHHRRGVDEDFELAAGLAPRATARCA